MPGFKLIHVSKQGPWYTILPISYWVTSLALRQLYDCHNGSWITLAKWVNMWREFTEGPTMQNKAQYNNRRGYFMGYAKRLLWHDDVMKWKHFSRYWPFFRGIHRSPVDSHEKGQWRGALMFSLICTWTNGWANNRDTEDLRRHCSDYDVTVMEGPLYTLQ